MQTEALVGWFAPSERLEQASFSTMSFFRPPQPTSPPPQTNQYGAVAAVYDRLMDNVPHALWLSRIEKAVRLRGKSPVSALDCACGTGLVTELLFERGYRPVVGFDLSAAMIDIARTKAQASVHAGRLDTPQFEVQNAAHLDLGDRTFDLVVSMFDSLNYILEPSDLQSAFHRLFTHTSANGTLAFDMNALYALSHDLFTQEQRFGPVQHDWKAHWDRETRLCRVEMDFWVKDEQTGETRTFHETHIQRAYTVPEVTEWLQNAGYRNIEVFGNYGERAPGAKSDRLLFIADKP